MPWRCACQNASCSGWPPQRRCVARLIHSTVCCCRRHLDGSSPSGRELQRPSPTRRHPPLARPLSSSLDRSLRARCTLRAPQVNQMAARRQFPPLSLSQPAPLPPPQMPPVVLGALAALASHHVCLSLACTPALSSINHICIVMMCPGRIETATNTDADSVSRLGLHMVSAALLLTTRRREAHLPRLPRRASWLATRRHSRHALSLPASLAACLMHCCRPSFSVPCLAVNNPALVQPAAASTHDYKFSRRCVLDASVRLLASGRFNGGPRPAN